METTLDKINYKFLDKPLLVGGKAKEFYKVRKSGADIDLIISSRDYDALSKIYPNNLKDLFGDLGVLIDEFEIWKTIALFDYEYLCEDSVELENYKVIALDKLLFMTTLAIEKEKYLNDAKLISQKILDIQYDKEKEIDLNYFKWKKK